MSSLQKEKLCDGKKKIKTNLRDLNRKSKYAQVTPVKMLVFILIFLILNITLMDNGLLIVFLIIFLVVLNNNTR